jgi:hypothetical protein
VAAVNIRKQLHVSVNSAGAVRLSADLGPEEMRHGGYVRDVDTLAARRLAIEILQAAEEVDRIIASRGCA